MPSCIRCRYSTWMYSGKLLHGLCRWLHAWALKAELTCDCHESRDGNVMRPGRSSSCGLYSKPWRSTVAPPHPKLSWGLWRERLLWDEHVYPALHTWFISTSKQPKHELFTLHCDTEGKREEGRRGRWLWNMSNVKHRNGRENGSGDLD